MKYNVKAPPSLTEQNLAIEIPDLPASVTPVITGTTPIDNPPPPDNLPPVVNAGQDLIISLPNTEVTLTGSGSDPDGSITSFLWEQISGTPANIVSPTSAQTKITSLTEGVRNFRLTVTDNKGAKKSDETKVTVEKEAAPPVPGNIEGYGSAVTGGNNSGSVVMCNSLTESALKNAIGTGNRIVRFGVSGTIKARLYFSNLKNVTIDGEGKITIDNNGEGDAIALEGSGCSNIIIKNLRFRNAGNDTMGIRCKNVVVDHCSFDDSGDGLLDLTDNAENVTVQYCIFGDSHSGAMLLAYAGTRNISVHHCVFTAWDRNPLIHRANNYQPTETQDLMCEFVNNIVSGWDSVAGSWVDYGGTAQFKNNWYSKASGAIVANRDSTKAKVFSSGNIAKGGATVGVNNHAEWPIPVANRITTQSAQQAAEKVKAEAGCRPLDSVDQAILNKISL